MSRKRAAVGHSISRRLTFMNLMVAGTALLVTSVALFFYDWLSFREAMIRDMSVQAQIIGDNTVSALLFDDPEAARTTLGALRSSPSVVSALVARPDGEILASYRTGADRPIPPMALLGPDGIARFEGGELVVGRPILLDGEPIGSVYIWSNLERLGQRLRRHVAIVLGAAAASLALALAVSSIARRAISRPIVHLAGVARQVSEDRNYALRASPVQSPAELAVLIQAFNAMLDLVESRDRELKEAHDDLELRVERRTAQLESANKELEAFAYSVSHDLRAPLRHMDGFSALLESQYGSGMDPGAQRYLALIRAGAQQMGRLIDDLLTLSRISRQRAVRQPTDMNDLVRSVIESLRPDMGDRQIEWRVSSLPSLECDPGLMKIVLTNLLGNAMKYTRGRERAMIEVSHASHPDGPVIFVRDNGAGFDQAYVHKLFGVFQRLHRNEDFEGTGIGLATVQRIIHAHGGRIWAEGEVDRGATFYFTVPAVSDTAPAARLETVTEAGGGD